MTLSGYILLIMKAENSQIPEAGVKTDGLTNPPVKGGVTLWAVIRRLTARVQSLELAASTARRDLNRIEKRQYRGKDNSPPSEVENPPENGGGKYNPALYG